MTFSRRLALSLGLCSLSTALYAVFNVQAAIGDLAFYGGSNAMPPADALSYANGTLTPHETMRLMHLSFPQSYNAIKNAIGFPNYRTNVADYYLLPNGRWVMLSYDQSNHAIALQIGDYQ